MTLPNSDTLCWEDLAEGLQRAIEFTVSDEDMRAFAVLSGDHNPLHIDDAFAKQRGFESKVVYGALIVAKVSQLIGMKLPGRDSVWSTLTMQFHRPLHVGQVATLTGTVVFLSSATNMIEIKVDVRAMGKLLAKGRAEVLLASK